MAFKIKVNAQTTPPTLTAIRSAGRELAGPHALRLVGFASDSSVEGSGFELDPVAACCVSGSSTPTVEFAKVDGQRGSVILAANTAAAASFTAHRKFLVRKRRLVPGGSQGISPKTRQPRRL
jgi:hypothetical protein